MLIICSPYFNNPHFIEDKTSYSYRGHNNNACFQEIKNGLYIYVIDIC